MPDPAQFGDKRGKKTSGPLDCATVESWLAEAAEKTIAPGVQEQLRAHAADCLACNEKLLQASRGREWLLVLKQEALEPPADLVSKILARTSLAKVPMIPDLDPELASARDRRIPELPVADGANQGSSRSSKGASRTTDTDPALVSVPLWQRNSVVVLRRTVLEPRLALVAAMAFFSISLTLNLMGIRLGSFHPANLAPGNVHRTITRQYADANARVVRYYENLRVVYEVEARVQQIRRASESTSPEMPERKPRKQSFNSRPDSRTGSGAQRDDAAEYQTIEGAKSAISSILDPAPVEAGPQMEAELQLAQHSHDLSRRQFFQQERQLA